MARAPKVAAVSAAEWKKLLDEFRISRDLETPDVRRRASRVKEFLQDESQKLYDLANAVERGEVADVDRATMQPRALVQRLISRGGFADDVIGESINELRDLPEIEPEASALRARGAEIWMRATALGERVDRHTAEGRAKRRGPVGRMPSVSEHFLFAQTTQWGATIREVAKRLADHGVELPDRRPGQRRLSAAERWERILYRAHSRYRNYSS